MKRGNEFGRRPWYDPAMRRDQLRARLVAGGELFAGILTIIAVCQNAEYLGPTPVVLFGLLGYTLILAALISCLTDEDCI